ncbi:MAG: phosphodiester glycosidase family protein [Syntrophomonadaceae bacterium]
MSTVEQSTPRANKKPVKKAAFIGITFVLVITLILLANRYLVEHVQIAAGATASNAVADATYAADQWNYASDSKTISIKEVTSGNGQNKVTYYVADVTVDDTSILQSAFAKNEYGTNIIETTSKIAADHNAVLAINGDYYGFRDNGILIRNGQIYRDSPARTGLKIYKDGSMEIYDETTTSAQDLLNEGVWQTLSFGPALVVDGQVQTNFDDVSIDKNFGNRTIENSNPRTGIGMIAPNHYVFVVVDGRSSESQGMTLFQFAQVFADFGCTEAYNLDGGGSSTMYFMGNVVNNPQGKNQERGTSDIIYV